jgi:hypothetical protein
MIFVVCELMPGSELSRRPSEERQLFTTVIAVAAGCGLGGMLTRKRRGPRLSVQDRASVLATYWAVRLRVAGTPPLIARIAAPEAISQIAGIGLNSEFFEWSGFSGAAFWCRGPASFLQPRRPVQDYRDGRRVAFRDDVHEESLAIVRQDILLSPNPLHDLARAGRKQGRRNARFKRASS